MPIGRALNMGPHGTGMDWRVYDSNGSLILSRGRRQQAIEDGTKNERSSYITLTWFLPRAKNPLRRIMPMEIASVATEEMLRG